MALGPVQKSRLQVGSWRLPAATILLIVAAGRAGQNERVVATWELKSVAGRAPETLNIKSWEIAFRRGGRWTYSGEMKGPYEGLKLSGDGTWKTEGAQIRYAAGDNQGQSEFMIEKNVLTLSPDPVVMPDGKTHAATTYQRVGD
jgi:hypothetical protein